MITVKEEFLPGEKAQRAIKQGGCETIVVWLAMKRYAAANLTNGFVPDEDIDGLPGAVVLGKAVVRKALTTLIGCGAMNANGERGAGLVDETPHGWQLHDYLDHANDADREADRRRKERDRKASYRAGRPADSPRDNSGTSKRDTGRDSPRDTARDRQRDGTRDLVRAPDTGASVARDPQPNPTQPEEVGDPPASPGKFPMHALWEPTTETIAGIEIAGVAPWAIAELTGRFKAHFLADPGETSDSVGWNQRCVKWVIGDWRVPSKRPKRLEDGPTPDLGDYGNASEWG